MLESPLAPEEINEVARIIDGGGTIPQSEWDNLSDEDKASIEAEIERLIGVTP